MLEKKVGTEKVLRGLTEKEYDDIHSNSLYKNTKQLEERCLYYQREFVKIEKIKKGLEERQGIGSHELSQALQKISGCMLVIKDIIEEREEKQRG